ncbi:Agamous-like MADS-box protein agl65 [Turnera subulata]|uniref:Agamous-like MADS-box protein agl65 n=1 Tax=Turnera subulata TaxID=218843 RepID=A0A9Q0FLC3_9ROSI|nr:Agamous-like MADS-box protein agl65 [Turnera subulata]
MGRRKLKIEKLECMKARQAKYSKRKIGLLKKAKELSILCDVDLALLMFSPTGKPSLFVGQNK